MIVQNFIHQPMLVSDTARPMARSVPFQRFRLARSVERVTHYLGNKGVYLLVYFFICFFPLTVFGKSGIVKANHFSITGLGAGFGFFQRFKVADIFPFFNVFNRLEQMLAVSGGTHEVFGCILFLHLNFNHLVGVCRYDRVNKGAFCQFIGIKCVCCCHAEQFNRYGGNGQAKITTETQR